MYIYEICINNILLTGYITKITLPTRLSENSTLIAHIFITDLNRDLSMCILDMHIVISNLLFSLLMMIYLQEINISQLEQLLTIKKITLNIVFTRNIYSIN